MTRAPQQRLQQSEEFFQTGISNYDDTTSSLLPKQYGAAHARSLAALAGRSDGTLPWRKLDVLTFVLGPSSCGENRIGLSSRQWRALRITDVKQSFLQMRDHA
jgi:hypothetical protein